MAGFWRENQDRLGDTRSMMLQFAHVLWCNKPTLRIADEVSIKTELQFAK